jgi:hypothetical protein
VKKIGSWWLAKFDAIGDEKVKHTFLANHTQSSKRAVGGKLFITDQRCLFSPHLIDYYTGGRKFEVDLANISSVDVKPAGGDTFGGGLRDRLKITHTQGEALFVINKLADVIDTIKSSISKGT